jgi:general secretion pathway protein E
MDRPHLIVKDSKGTRTVPVAGSSLTIGRNLTNLVMIEEPLASRFHCVIEKTRDGYQIRDLESRNGTMLNGQPVKTSRIGSGDVVTIGGSELKLVIPNNRTTRPAGSGSAQQKNARGELEELVVEPDLSDLEPPALDDIPEEEPGGPTIIDDNAPMWERSLRERADSLPNKQFAMGDIGLVNARGQMAHAPKPGESKSMVGSEALTLFRLVLLVCFRTRATDIHIEPHQDDFLIRVRVDGVMIEILQSSDKDLCNKLLSVVKVLSDIDIAQRNIVQEGSFSSRVPGGHGGPPVRRVDYRVSFAPAVYGQKLVIRILDASNAPLHIDNLGLPATISDSIRHMIGLESGMILVCGPTGSGKTTTLYAMLRDIDVNERNVVTIEDPVEIQLPGVTQIPVNEAQENTFSKLLRSVLRQDPDIILVGEVRDLETARTAVQASMTGHLVFSTVHSRDCVGAIYRLLDLGVEPYLVSSGLHMVLAQRLVRQLCKYCKVPAKPTPKQIETLAEYGIHNLKHVFEPRGCRRCLNTGFFGRRTVVELLNFNSELRQTVLKTPTMTEIMKKLGPANFTKLSESGYQLVADGISSFDEVEKAVM